MLEATGEMTAGYMRGGPVRQRSATPAVSGEGRLCTGLGDGNI